MIKEFRLYRQYIKINLLSGMEYKGWWLMIFQVLVVTIVDPLTVVLVFSRFGSIGEWTMERILLIYAMAFTSYGLAESFFRGFTYFPEHLIRTGNFDRILLRPKSLFTQVSASFFHVHRTARVAVGLCIIFWALSRLNVDVTFLNAVILVFALAGGMMTYAGVIVISASVAFFTIKAMDWIYIFTSASREVARVPIDYVPRVLRYMFTFLMPMLVISYFPASAIVGFGGAAWRGWLALPAGALFFWMSMLVWRVGVRHYQSTGS